MSHVEATISQIKKHPAVMALVFLGSIVMAIYAFTDAATKLANTVSSLFGESPASAREKLSRLSLPFTADAFVRTAAQGDLYAVRLFLVAGIDPNAKDSTDHATALSEAVRAGHVEIVRALVHAKANVDGVDLNRAAWEGDIELLKALLQERRDAAALDGAFVAAAAQGHREILVALMDKGVSIDAAGVTALLAAADAGYGAIYRDQALEARQIGTVRFLLDHRVNPNAADQDGWTPLHLAARNGAVDVVNLLLERRVDPNPGLLLGPEKDWTPLMVALWRWNGRPNAEESEAIVKALLAKGADVNVKGALGKTPLLLAANFSNANVFRVLLEAGARPDETDAAGRTAAGILERNDVGRNEKEREEIRLLLRQASAAGSDGHQ